MVRTWQVTSVNCTLTLHAGYMVAILVLNSKKEYGNEEIIAILAVALCISSCDSYLDINQDPNSPSEGAITASGIFPGVEMNLANSYGNFLRITGGYYAQYYAQLFGTGNYLDFSQFTMSATRSSGTYSALNGRCLSNLKTIRELSSASEDWGYLFGGYHFACVHLSGVGGHLWRGSLF